MSVGRPLVDRLRAVDAARIGTALEGAARGTDATRADQDAYVRGEIDIAELESWWSLTSTAVRLDGDGFNGRPMDWE